MPRNHAAYNRSERGKERRRRYRHDNSKWLTDAQYLAIPFVGVDGEGITQPDGSHDYIMLAVSGQPPLRRPDNGPLSTMQIIEYLFYTLNPGDINVIYGGGYDFNMWCKDLTRGQLTALYKGGFMGPGIMVGGYRIKWTPGKMFTIKKAQRTIVIYDVVSFFQQPFIGACDDVLKEYEGRDVLVRMKAARGVFRQDEADEMAAYNNLEVDLLVRLMSVLREHLNAAKLRPRRWYGPGALASALLTREGVAEARAETPPPVAQAARFAYAGGRFEQFKYGHVDTEVWENDINSAYPAAIQKLPNLARGFWEHHSADPGAKPFAVYRVTYTADDPMAPGAFFYRSPRGAIFYPPTVTNWVWGPEVEAARRYVAKYGGELVIHEAWSFVREPGVPLPFEFVGTLYAKRQAAKRAGEGVQIAYKLCLNSLYGKLAQQIGYIKATAKKPAKIPPFHQLEWAGFVTSSARALILDAITLDRDAVIAVETDALFTTRPLPELPHNDGLGAWKETHFADLTYVQSGHYYGTEIDDRDGSTSPVVKCRGIDKGYVSRETVDDLLDTESQPILPAYLTRFVGAGQALMQGLDKWCRWITGPRQLALYPNGKREHIPYVCGTCVGDGKLGREWHDTVCAFPGGQSHEYPIAWVNPNEAMSELDELREAELYYED